MSRGFITLLITTAFLTLAAAHLRLDLAPNANDTTPVAVAPVVCSNYSTVHDCVDDCFWCAQPPRCASIGEMTLNATCSSGWCAGDLCERYECTSELFPCSRSIVGMLLLMALYGLILAFGAKLISDGSEELLELFPKFGTVIGALLLPVLGAVPDAAIVVASGAVGTVAEAQEQLSVGVGTLAGSTIMLLTIPWCASMWLARCDFNWKGKAIDGKLTKKWSLLQTGVTVDGDTPKNARIMMFTALSYLIVQGVAFAYLKDPSGGIAKQVEKNYALAGFIVCMALLLAYCVYQVLVPRLAEKRKDAAAQKRAEKSMMLRAHYYLERMGFMEKVTQRFIDAADKERAARSKALKLGRHWRKIAARRRLEREGKSLPHDEAGDEEKVSGEKQPLLHQDNASISESAVDLRAMAVQVEKESEEEAEDGEHQSFWKTLGLSILTLAIGVALVTIFSDPMVDTIGAFAGPSGININAFYVSFLLTPFCSNASELISSLIFAAKKRKANTSMTFSQLYGAATMNATMVLGIFFALIYFRGLAWSFSAETVAILFVTMAVGAVSAFKKTFAVWWSFPILLLYPLSLVLVYVLGTAAFFGVEWVLLLMSNITTETYAKWT